MPAGDHPRSRGVYARVAGARVGGAGSSPLARGLQGIAPAAWCGAGIIPARAGFTSPRHTGPGRGGDHPRSRGVYRSSSWSRSRPAGSSPLARGLLVGLVHVALDDRIIPARAGFTPPTPRTTTPTGDHPRSRGVYPRVRRARSRGAGSSPLARGLRREPARQSLFVGIIPARAGFTPTGEWTVQVQPDHPRSRGVYTTPSPAPGPTGGSSPLARGLQGGNDWLAWRIGIIPARAGFTRATARARRPTPDHPRSRGVYAVVPSGLVSAHGSSPLARGLRALRG